MGTHILTRSTRQERKLENIMSVQVKAILHRGPNEEELPRKEIRRFEVDANVAGSYDFLRAKIIALYPDLTEDSAFRLMWTDDEGDNVCFSTDEEYAQALKFVNGQENKLFKVMVKMKAKQQFHESKAKQLNDMLKSINPQMHHHAQHFGEAMQ